MWFSTLTSLYIFLAAILMLFVLMPKVLGALNSLNFFLVRRVPFIFKHLDCETQWACFCHCLTATWDCIWHFCHSTVTCFLQCSYLLLHVFLSHYLSFKDMCFSWWQILLITQHPFFFFINGFLVLMGPNHTTGRRSHFSKLSRAVLGKEME